MTTPTRQEIIDAYKALEELYDWALEWAGPRAPSRYGAIRAALPPKPRPTMADVEWDDELHYLAEAETEMGTKVIMLWETTMERITIINDGVMGYARPENLTPTGRRYTLTEAHDE